MKFNKYNNEKTVRDFELKLHCILLFTYIFPEITTASAVFIKNLYNLYFA